MYIDITRFSTTHGNTPKQTWKEKEQNEQTVDFNSSLQPASLSLATITIIYIVA